MPLEAQTTDQPSQTLPYADTLAPNSRPALSATSDMPKFTAAEPVEATPVDTEVKPADAPDTSDAKPEGEANVEPTKIDGEEQDKTSPQARAAYARERNRRQAAERESAELKATVTQLVEAVSKLTTRDQPKEDQRPVRDTFDTPDAYDTALETWAGKRAASAAKAEFEAGQAKQDRERQASTLVDAYQERKTAFEADHPDFDDLVMDDGLKISPAMSQAILEAEDGPAIAYHLAQNPDMAERLAKLSPAQAVYEIGKISTRLANPPRPRAEPIRPLSARNSAAEKSPSEMSMDEYAAYRKSRAN